MGHVLLGEAEECEDDGKNVLQSFEERLWLTVSQDTDLRAAKVSKTSAGL